MAVKAIETTVGGLQAVQALFDRNPEAVKRLFFDRPTSPRTGGMTSRLAKAKKVYRLVEPAELEKIAGTKRHGGIVAVIEARSLPAPGPEEVRTWARQREPLLLLDRVGNAHNLGAIVRTAAFFGVRRIVLADDPAQALPGEAAYRVAEGGMEHVNLFLVQNLAGFCRELALLYEVVGTSLKGKDLRKGGLATPGRPVALVLGNEEHGLAAEVAAACSRLVKIPGTDTVESLNVSVAAAVLIWELLAVGPKSGA